MYMYLRQAECSCTPLYTLTISHASGRADSDRFPSPLHSLGLEIITALISLEYSGQAFGAKVTAAAALLRKVILYGAFVRAGYDAAGGGRRCHGKQPDREGKQQGNNRKLGRYLPVHNLGTPSQGEEGVINSNIASIAACNETLPLEGKPKS